MKREVVKPDLDLIHKYDVPAPRYTSYPTAVQFRPVESSGRFSGRLKEMATTPRDLSLYFHIPFCFSLCWYCGCTRIITRDGDRGDHYLHYLEKELSLNSGLIHPDSNVIQIHFGGGTPTFLSPDQLEKLGEMISRHFRIAPDVEYSVEIDPRSCSPDQVESLRAIGCNRASIGVQDTNPEVQKAVHRVQPTDQVRRVVENLRSSGIESINFDLIYGLPRQTPETFEETLGEIAELGPDRLAVYSYAHLPDRFPAQKLLKPDELPSTEEKMEMLYLAIDRLGESGYRYIGMDHFARESDPLSRALDEGTLQRNFQGYSTRSRADMVAFGMSGISQTSSLYYQNTKELKEYYELLDEEVLPVVRYLELTHDDQLRRDLIMQIMCRAEVEFDRFSKKWKIDFKDYFGDEMERLVELEEDGLVHLDNDHLQPTEKGRLFLRNIALVFDAHLKKPDHEARYSRTV